MSNKIALKEGTEEFLAIKKGWQKKAGEATIKSLPGFLTELTEKYQHDYGTICHAVAIAAQAAAKAMDHGPQGGITGFQAGCIMWQFIREWNCSDNKTGMKLVDYDNFLYPQYADKFDKTLSSDIWKSIQKEATVQVKNADEKYADYLKETEQYKKDIAVFVGEYPDYYENKEHYDPLGIGTGEQWEAEAKKKESGFEFAPQEPYCPVDSNSAVYIHWLSIINGKVPFGYTIEGE